MLSSEEGRRKSYLPPQLPASGVRLGQIHETNSSVDRTATAICRPFSVLLCFISWRRPAACGH